MRWKCLALPHFEEKEISFLFLEPKFFCHFAIPIIQISLLTTFFLFMSALFKRKMKHLESVLLFFHFFLSEIKHMAPMCNILWELAHFRQIFFLIRNWIFIIFFQILSLFYFIGNKLWCVASILFCLFLWWLTVHNSRKNVEMKITWYFHEGDLPKRHHPYNFGF